MAGQHIVGGRGGRRGAEYQLQPPVVVGAGIAFHGPRVLLTVPLSPNQIARRRTLSELKPPAVVAAPFFAQPVSINYWVAVKSKENSGLVRRLPFSSKLGPPRVVDAGIAFRGPRTRITDPLSPSQIATRRRTLFELKPPQVVNPAAAAFIARPINVNLAAPFSKQSTALQRRAPTYVLRKPAVVGAGIVFRGIQGRLTYSRRGRPKSELFAPVVIGSGISFGGPRSLLTYSRRGRPKSDLFAPAVVGSGIAFGGPGKLLTYSRRGVAKSVLRRPIVVGSVGVFAPVRTELAYSRRGAPKSFLRPPVLPPLAPPVSTYLQRIRPLRTHSFLRAPVVVGAGITFTPITVSLAPSSRGAPKSVLREPTVVAVAEAFYGPQVHFATGRNQTELVRRHARPFWIGPAVLPPAAAVLGGTLIQYVRTPRTHARPFLSPPAVVSVVVTLAYPIRVTLTKRRTGYPIHSTLRPPIIPSLAQPITVALQQIRPVKTHSRLAPPAVVGAGIVYRALQTELTYSRRGIPKSDLRSPAAIGSGIFFRPVLTHLTYSKRGKPRSLLFAPVIPPLARPLTEKLVTSLVRTELADRQPHSHLFPPAVIGAGISFGGPRVLLVRSSRGQTKSLLIPPAAIVEISKAELPQRVHLVRIRPVTTHSILRTPAVVGAGIAFAGPGRLLTYSKRGRPQSHLFVPAVVNVTFVARPILSQLAASTRGTPKSRLFAPVLPPLAPPVREKLVTNLVRTELADRQPHSRLAPPTVVGAAVVFRGLTTHLAPAPRQGRQSHSGLGRPIVVFQLEALGWIATQLVRIRPVKTTSRLSQPAVVTVVVFQPPISTQLVRVPQRRAQSHLSPPAVVGSGISFAGPGRLLTYSRRGRAKSFLRAPVVVVTTQIFRPLEIKLAYSRRGVAKSHLYGPAVIGAGAVFRGIDVTLAASRRGKTVYDIGVPLVDPGIVFLPVDVRLAASTRISRLPHSKLQPPATVAVAPFRPIKITLVRIRPVPTRSVLRQGIVGAGIAFFGPKVLLVPSYQIGRQRRYLSILHEPAVVFQLPAFNYPVRVTLAASPKQARKPHSHLTPPAVVGAGRVFVGIRGHLAYSRRGKPLSKLRASTAVTPIVYPGIRVTLTYSTRGKPLSGLGAGMEGAGIFFEQIRITLAPSRRVRVHSQLRAPVIPPLARPIKTTLVRIRPVRTQSRLPEIVSFAVSFHRVNVTLAPSRFPRPKSVLRKPAVIGAGISFSGPRVLRARSFRGQPFSTLRQPVVVGQPIIKPTFWLAPSSRGKTLSILRAPAVTGLPGFRPIVIHLAPSIRGIPSSLLKPPTVVASGIVFRGLLVHLALSTRGHPRSHLSPGASRFGIHGCVTGYDFSPFDVSGFDQSDVDVSGSDSGPQVSGSDSGNTVVSGSDTSQTTVSGSDERNC